MSLYPTIEELKSNSPKIGPRVQKGKFGSVEIPTTEEENICVVTLTAEGSKAREYCGFGGWITIGEEDNCHTRPAVRNLLQRNRKEIHC